MSESISNILKPRKPTIKEIVSRVIGVALLAPTLMCGTMYGIVHGLGQEIHLGDKDNGPSLDWDIENEDFYRIGLEFSSHPSCFLPWNNDKHSKGLLLSISLYYSTYDGHERTNLNKPLLRDNPKECGQ